MKKYLLLLVVSFLVFSANAEQVVGNFKNSYFEKEYSIEASLKNDILQTVFIGVEAKSANQAFISIDGKDLERFKTSLELIRDKYLEWVTIAKEHNVPEMHKEFDIKFPSVDVVWSGSKWWFSYYKTINMRFIILDNGKMVASWAPKVKASSNEYIDENIYFVFACEEDFNNLISKLDYKTILDQLLTTKNNEDLFH